MLALLHRRVRPHARLGTGVFVSGLALAVVGAVVGSPLLIPPFVATAMIKHEAPHSPMAQPRAIAGGHVLAAVIGMAVGAVLGAGSLEIALAASLAAVGMTMLDVKHPPAVATAFVAVQDHANHWFPAYVSLGALTLIATMAALAVPLHRLRYPAPATRG